MMVEINWNKMSDLGLIQRINKDILHPLGLAMTRNPENGSSESILIADNGVWEYSKDILAKKTPSDLEVREAIKVARDGG